MGFGGELRHSVQDGVVPLFALIQVEELMDEEAVEEGTEADEGEDNAPAEEVTGLEGEESGFHLLGRVGYIAVG